MSPQYYDFTSGDNISDGYQCPLGNTAGGGAPRLFPPNFPGVFSVFSPIFLEPVGLESGEKNIVRDCYLS